MGWIEDPLNREHLTALSGALADSGRVLIFLGAGLSFGAARSGGRSRFDNDWMKDMTGGKGEPPKRAPGTMDWSDDGEPLPSWTWLISRMQARLINRVSSGLEEYEISRFFENEGPLDCAELFRKSVGDQNYREFLQSQFDTSRHPYIQPTTSHRALMALDLPLLFTTNFDELIEITYRKAGTELRVSADEAEFKAHMPIRPTRHLVKLHGTITRSQSLVLTRTDYAHSRRVRREMFSTLRGEIAHCTFLFIGFSLADPNFNILLDDVHDSLGMDAPLNYTVQASKNQTRARYLEALGVNTIWLDNWNDLPEFLRLIHPDTHARSG